MDATQFLESVVLSKLDMKEAVKNLLLSLHNRVNRINCDIKYNGKDCRNVCSETRTATTNNRFIEIQLFSSFPPDPEMTRAPFKPPSGGMESAK